MKCKKLPKWLVLQEDEVFIKSYIVQQPLFVITMASAIVVMLSAGIAFFVGGAGDGFNQVLVALGTGSTAATAIAQKRAFLTNMRLICGNNSKPEQEIRLSEIQAIEMNRNLAGGNIKVHGNNRKAKPIVIHDWKSQQVALAIQEAASNAETA